MQEDSAITTNEVSTMDGFGAADIPFGDLMQALRPVIIKGAVNNWQLVRAGRISNDNAINYLKGFENGKTVATFFGEPTLRGRYFYNEDATGLNFDIRRVPLLDVLDEIQSLMQAASPRSIYVGSSTVDACLPGLRVENDLHFDHPMFANNTPLASIWIGNRSVASAHYDAPNNIACCAVGRRRYTLFPPEQVHNLYPGPLEPTPGGQAISMVNFAEPDYDRFPRFRIAVESAMVANLEPGDVLFYPSMWWHQVEAFDTFNVMINYWWNNVRGFMGTPMNVLKHALFTLRDRPDHEKAAWKEIFDYYVFGTPERPREHLHEDAYGELGPMDDLKARRLRAELLRKLNR
jgi:hypothetical protein